MKLNNNFIIIAGITLALASWAESTSECNITKYF